MEQVMLDMIPTGAKAVCHVSQYDIGRTIRFNLRSGGAVYTLSGTETIKVYIKKPDGTTAERNIANTSSTYVDWVTGEGDCDQAGECECELVITSGTTVIGSKNFTVKIEEDPYNEQGVVTETAGPAVIATFTTNVVDLLQEVKCSINPIQNGTPWIDSNEVNKVPYIKRAVAGTATRIGNHLYDKLVGGTVAFNQLVESISYSGGGITITTNADNEIVINGTATETAYAWINNTATYSVVNHVYLVTLTKALDGVLVYNDNGGVSCGYPNTATIGKATANNRFYLRVYNGSSFNNDKTKANIIDLTQMFGSTIADYIYSLEQATAGAGVAWFKALFPNDYYAYNAGELMSVKATAHIMRNASNTVIGNYALDSNLVLNGLFKLDENNKLYADGDTYESSGAVGRKYTQPINLGALSWRYETSEAHPYFYANIDEKKLGRDIGMLCPKYTYVMGYRSDIIANDKCIGNFNQSDKTIVIRDDNYSDATAFKTAMNGVYLICEKATPTTEQASPFTNPQVCDENGTEEYTDNRAVAIPVGHETYQANICPITGFDELNVGQSGINLWDEVTESGRYNISTGNKESARGYICTSNRITVKEGITYTLVKPIGLFMRVVYYNNDGTFNSSPDIIHTYAETESITIPSGVGYLCFNILTETYGNNISFNYPSTDTQYHSYSGKLIKLEFDDTVYLAEVSCLNGVWKLKLLGAEVDLGTLNYTMYSVAQGKLFRSDEFDVKRVTSTTEVPDIISSIFVAVASANRANHTISMVNNTARIDIIDDDYSDAVTFKSAMSGVKLVYPLATPVEITLDETEQFEALLGVNNVWHDGNGNTEVKYLYNA